MVAAKETIDQILETYRQAAQVAGGSSLRSGNVVSLSPDDCDELMITADLHGHRRNFNRILEVASLDQHSRRHLLMQEVCHGGPTYPTGGGCMSHLMLEEIAALQVKYGERFHFILSNHELAELTDFPIMKSKRMLNLLFRCGLQEMYGDAADEMRDAIVEFLAALPLAIRVGDLMICHSLPADIRNRGFDATVFERDLTESDLSEGGDVFRMVWGRDYSQQNADAFANATGAKSFVTGHEPCERGYHAPNSRQMIIDCCGDKACYISLPLGETVRGSTDLLRHVRHLHNGVAVAASAN